MRRLTTAKVNAKYDTPIRHDWMTDERFIIYAMRCIDKRKLIKRGKTNGRTER